MEAPPGRRQKHPQVVVVYQEVPGSTLKRPATIRKNPVPVVAMEVRQTRDRKPNTRARIVTN
jgi:hypothetical protein